VPPLCGWAAVTNSLDAAPILMFAIIFLWTPPHFWALAIRFQDEYAAAGVPMLPVTHGAIEARKRSLVYTAITVFASLLLYATGDLGEVYLAVAAVTGVAFLWLAWRQIQVATAAAAMRVFHFSLYYLAVLFLAMVADRLIL
jgi:protoheme IX farnesyltransferase